MARTSRWFVSCCTVIALMLAVGGISQSQSPTQEAPTGFDNLSNGMTAQQMHDADRLTFSEIDTASAAWDRYSMARPAPDAIPRPSRADPGPPRRCELATTKMVFSSIRPWSSTTART